MNLSERNRKNNLILLCFLITVISSFYLVTKIVGIDNAPTFHYKTQLKEIIIATVPLSITVCFPSVRKMLIDSFDVSPLIKRHTWYYMLTFFVLHYLINKFTYDYEIFIEKNYHYYI